jgi:hypothetical protein
VKAAGLTTWEVTGPDLPALAEKIRGKPGVEQVVAFGTTLHVSGRDAEKLRASVQSLDDRRVSLETDRTRAGGRVHQPDGNGEGQFLVKLHEFNWHRFWAIVCKEFIQMRRDRLTFGMMVGIPMLQLILFGYAINSDPKHLPTAVYSADNSVFSRTLVWGLRNSSYFDITREPKNEAEIQKMLAQGTVQFAVDIPVDFSRKLLRGEKPDLLLEADATDPSAIGYAVAAVNQLATTVLNRDLTGPLADLAAARRRRSIWSCINITIRKTSRNTTSCPASWA